MDTNELKKRIAAEAASHNINLTEDELNAKVLEASRIEPEKLDRLNGGWLANCDETYLCWSDYLCIAWNRGKKGVE